MATLEIFLWLAFGTNIAFISSQTTSVNISSSVNISTASSNTTVSSSAATTSTPTSLSANITTDQNISTIVTTVPPEVPETPAINPLFELNLDIPFCTCDLTAAFCDINCCCDRSCTTADREAFSSCDEVLQSFPGSPVCVPANTIFLNNAPYKCEVIDNECCLQKTDTDSQNYLDPSAVLNNEVVLANYIREYGSYSFASSSTMDDELLPEATNYKNGDFLYTLDEVNIKGLFIVPGVHASTGDCLDRTPAKFLHDTSVTCVRRFELPISSLCATAGYLNSSSYTSLLFMDSPYLFGNTEISVDSLVAVEQVELARANFYLANNTCYNIVTEVMYTITHNAGILSAVNVAFNLDSFSGDVLSITQKYTVNYRDSNDTLFVPRSGNPGYIIGEPVLAGFLVDSNEKITFDTNRGSVLTILSSTLSGECISANRQTVNFGENIISACNLSPAAESVDCPLSSLLSRFTLLDDSLNASVRIATFGNSSFDSVGDWVTLLRDDFPSPSHCNGFTVTLEILYAKIGSLANPQNQIVGAKLNFDAVQLYSQTGLPLHTALFSLTTIVSFLDVSDSTDSYVAPTGLTDRDYIVFGVLGGVTVLLFLSRVLDS